MNYDWKKGDKIICVNNIGMIDNLTIGKTYIVNYTYIEGYSFNVNLMGDKYKGGVFCRRFVTLKQQRKEKLQKIKQSI